jgi:hypothetical protein
MTASPHENRYDPIIEAFEGRRTPGSFPSILQLVIYGYIFAKEAQVTSVHTPAHSNWNSSFVSASVSYIDKECRRSFPKVSDELDQARHLEVAN